MVSNVSIKKGKNTQIQAWIGPKVSMTLSILDLVKIRCQFYARSAFTPQEIILVLFSVRGGQKNKSKIEGGFLILGEE